MLMGARLAWSLGILSAALAIVPWTGALAAHPNPT